MTGPEPTTVSRKQPPFNTIYHKRERTLGASNYSTAAGHCTAHHTTHSRGAESSQHTIRMRAGEFSDGKDGRVSNPLGAFFTWQHSIYTRPEQAHLFLYSPFFPVFPPRLARCCCNQTNPTRNPAPRHHHHHQEQKGKPQGEMSKSDVIQEPSIDRFANSFVNNSVDSPNPGDLDEEKCLHAPKTRTYVCIEQ